MPSPTSPAIDLTGRVALVTGGSRGLGRAMAFGLAGAGAQVVVASRNGEHCEATAAEITAATGIPAWGLAAHVGHWAALDGLVETVYDRLGRVDILINNAGMSPVYDAVTDVTEELFDKVVAVNLKGPFRLSALVGTRMVAAGGGSIVNIASQLGQIGGIELAHYSGAKAAIIGMTKSLAREVSSRGVRVNAVAPGPINTPLVMELSDEWRERKKSELPLGRFGEPEEVAETVAFLASPAASLFVGQTLGPNSGDVML